MYSGQTIVLKNLRQVPPNTAKVIRLQRQLIEAVQRYQELISNPDKDEEGLQSLLREIAEIDRCQREELKLVREAEQNYSASQEIPNSRSSTGSSIYDSAPENSENGSGSEDDLSAQPNEDDREASSPPSPMEESCEQSDSVPAEAEESSESTEEVPMDWEDLTREQWTESDRLLQKIDRVGTKIVQRDFLSCVDLVHVTQYKKAEEAIAQRKLRDLKGKKVITTGPWQMIDIPTKVNNRRCNYLTGLHVTVRQKDPKRSAMQSSGMELTGVKTRHHDSRGSSRASSRASSPISSQFDSFSKESNTSAAATKMRSVKTRGIKAKKTALMQARSYHNNNNNQKQNPASKNALPSSVPSSSQSLSNSDTSDSAVVSAKNSSRTLEPCVTCTVVDGVPHFKVFFPSAKDSTASPAANSTPKGTKPMPAFSPHASIVESDIEIHATIHAENGASPLSPDRKLKSSAKSVKRPRLSQSSYSPPALSPKSISNPETCSSKEDVGVVEANRIEKCGSWMSSPHFKTYRTFPTVSSASSDSPGSSSVPVVPIPTMKPVILSPVPKLTSPVAAKLAMTANKSPSAVIPSLTMPKLTIGNQAFKNATPTVTPLPQASPGGKFVPIAPKITSNVSNIVIVPLNDKNQSNSGAADKRPAVSLLKACTSFANSQSPASAGDHIKRPAVSLLKACAPFNSSQNSASTGTFLTVKNLKECLQNGKQYKDMKVVVQKVPVPAIAPAPGHVAAPQTPVQRLPLADAEDLKKKVVKLFPSPGTDVIDQQKSDDNPAVPTPTVIVADMSV